MLQILDACQFIQKQFQISLRYHKQLDAVFNWITAFTDVLIYDKFPCSVVVGKALRNQQRHQVKLRGKFSLK